MDYNFWDDRTHELEINPCEGCSDYQAGECISNGGYSSSSVDFPTQDDCLNCWFYNHRLEQCDRLGGCRYDV